MTKHRSPPSFRLASTDILSQQSGLHQTQRSRPVRKAPPRLQRFSSNVFSKLAQQTRYMEPSLGQKWSDIVGKDIAALCWPGRLSPGRQDRSLEIFTPNGASATKLNYQTEQILSAINRVMGPRAVTRLAIRQNGKTLSSSPLPSSPMTPKNTSSGHNREEEELTLDQVLAKFRALKE